MKNFSEWKKYSGEIQDILGKTSHLIEHCCHNMGVQEYAVMESKMYDLKRQILFWEKMDDPKRFVYELKGFANWLCDFIADKEREFWNEDS